MPGRHAMKETIESAASAWDGWERFMGRIGLAGLIGLGVLILIGFGEFGEAVPRHREVGAAMVGVGALFLVATFARGRFGAFVKNLSLFIAIGGLAGGAAYGVWREVRIADALANDGVVRTMRVESSALNVSGGGGHRVRLVDGARRITVEREASARIGSDLTLLTHPDRDDWYAETGEGSGHLEILDARGSKTRVFIAAGAALLLGLWALAFLFSALTGGPAPDRELAPEDR